MLTFSLVQSLGRKISVSVSLFDLITQNNENYRLSILSYDLNPAVRNLGTITNRKLEAGLVSVQKKRSLNLTTEHKILEVLRE